MPEDDPGSPGGKGQETNIVDSKSSFPDNWSDGYPEDDRATLMRFNGKPVDEFAKSFMSLRRKFGKDPDRLIERPQEGAPPEEVTAFYRQLGTPEKAEDYKFERSKDLSDKVDTDDAKVAAFSQIALKYDLDQRQFNGIVNDYLALVDKDITAFDLIEQDKAEQAFTEAETALKKDFGAAYDEKVARANAILRKYEGQEMVAELGLENNPAMTKFLDNIAEDMSEDRIKGLTSVTTPTPHAVEEKIRELRDHPAYLDESHPQHQEIVDELSALYKKKSA